MNCTNCSGGTPFSFNTQLFYNQECFGCGSNDCGANVQNSKCVIYTGPNLSCAGIETNDSIEFAIQKIDEQICSISGDYSTYQFACLEAAFGDEITTEADFVNAITSYICDFKSEYDVFINTTFPEYQESVTELIEGASEVSITCLSAGVTDSDDLQTVLEKYCAKFEEIDEAFDLGIVDWNNCLTVVTEPTSLNEAFSLVVDQICQVKALIGSSSSQTFNNSTSCIAGGASDSLATTISLIKTRLCLTPTFDKDNLLWGCLTEPTYSNDQDITAVLQEVIDLLADIRTAIPTFDGGDFSVTQTDLGDACAGVTVALGTPLDVDRFVGVSALDATPGTLIDKIVSSGNTVDVTNDSDSFLNIEIADGDKGDLSVAGNAWTIADEAVTFAKFQNVTSARLVGRTTGGSGVVEEISAGSHMNLAAGILNTYGRTLIDVEAFTASGTWTKPSGCNAVLVITIGAGGGGGHAISDLAEAAAGSGGGSGGIQYHFIESGLGASEAVAIGVGGAAGTAGGDGANGGFTTFGSHTKAGGGSGGIGMTSDTAAIINDGGTSGGYYSFPTGLLYQAYGTSGERGIRLSGTIASNGVGGTSFAGGSILSGGVSAGSGGSGGLHINAGSASTATVAGGDGMVIIYSYS